MKEIDKYHVVASAVRIELDQKTDALYLIFQITDEEFRNRIKKDWTQDIDLKIINVRVGEKTQHKLVELKG